MPPDMTSYVVCDDMFSTFYLILIILVSEINVIISEENSEKYLKRLHSRSSRSFQVSLMLHHLRVLDQFRLPISLIIWAKEIKMNKKVLRVRYQIHSPFNRTSTYNGIRIALGHNSFYFF